MFDDKEKNISSRLRFVYDLTMGVLWIGVGIFFLFHRKWGFDLNLNNDVLTNIFGVSSILYGAFRLYRGFKNK